MIFETLKKYDLYFPNFLIFLRKIIQNFLKIFEDFTLQSNFNFVSKIGNLPSVWSVVQISQQEFWFNQVNVKPRKPFCKAVMKKYGSCGFWHFLKVVKLMRKVFLFQTLKARSTKTFYSFVWNSWGISHALIIFPRLFEEITDFSRAEQKQSSTCLCREDQII